MHHLNIDGLQSAADPQQSLTQVYCSDSDALLFTGTEDEAQLFADVHGGELEFVTLQDLTRGFA